jgi:tetratricopeptide (TPR) repeat protein
MQATAQPSTPTELFIAAAEQDQPLRRALETQLSLLHRRGLVTVWHADKIGPGTERAQEIDAHLNVAGVIVLLISPALAASDYWYGQVIPRALERHAAGQVRVIPVLARPVDGWEGAAFGRLAPLPANRRAITEWRIREQAYVDVVAGIRQTVEALQVLTAGRSRLAGNGSAGPDADETAPGRPHSLWNVPHRRNAHFTGRDDLLMDLRRALASGQPAAITGLGGVGKTQLAVEYAYQHAADYRLIWWVRAEKTATLAADYAGLAGALELPEQAASDQAIAVEAVRKWLAGHGDWLLVFDNIQEPDDLDAFLPRRHSGHVLITSRNRAWGGRSQPLEVRPLARAAATEFLLERTGQTDRQAAMSLARDTGDLPLALEQAAAYVDATGLELAEYVERFRTRQAELMSVGRLTEYPQTVAATWELAFHDLREAAPAAADLLALCAFLAPEALPVELLRAGAVHLPAGSSLVTAVADDLRWDETVAALRRYSLVDIRSGELSVHRLVQAMGREELSEAARRTWAEVAIKVLAAAFPSDSHNLRTWPRCAALLPHALAAAGHAEALQLANEQTGRLLNQVGRYLEGRAEFAEARDLFERALRIAEATRGPDHWTTARYLNSLGGVLRAQRDLVTAREYLERALRIDRAVLTERPEGAAAVATDLNNLALVLQDEGDLVGARAHLEWALQIDENTWGPEAPEVAIRLSNLGGVLRAQGDLAEARALLERALQIMEKFHSQIGRAHV